MKLALIGAIFLTVAGSSFWMKLGKAASYVNETCRDFEESEVASNDNVSAIFKSGIYLRVRECSERGQAPYYYVFSVPSKSSLGVCGYSQRRIFMNANDGVPKWSVTPPSERSYLGREDVFFYDARSIDACPVELGDYVQVAEITDVEFLEHTKMLVDIVFGTGGKLSECLAMEDFTRRSRLLSFAKKNEARNLSIKSLRKMGVLYSMTFIADGYPYEAIVDAGRLSII